MAIHYRRRGKIEEKLREQELRRRCVSLAVSFSALALGIFILFATVFLVRKEVSPMAFTAYIPPEKTAEELPPAVAQTPTPQHVEAGGVVNPTVELVSQAPSVKMETVDLGDTGIVSDLAVAVNFDIGDLGSGQAAGDGSLGEQEEGDGSGGEGVESGGTGTGGGTGGGGLGTPDELHSSLCGTFYDLKLTRKGKPSPFQDPRSGGHNHSRRAKLADLYHRFLRKWSREILEPYYVSPTKLYATHFYLPNCAAGYGPYAFQCDPKTVKAQTWVAIYRGKVIAPKTGTFRFVGTGDDVLCIRFNNELVLEAGWSIPTLHDGRSDICFTLGCNAQYQANIRRGHEKGHKDYELFELPKGWEWNIVGGLTAGTPFKVEEGKAYPIEILISEIPGGRFGFAVFIEEMTTRSRRRGRNADRTFDLFRTDDSVPDHRSIEKLLKDAGFPENKLQCPSFNKHSPIWKAIPDKS